MGEYETLPIYEYKCGTCGQLFERLAKNSDDHPEECPSCGAPKPVKQFSTFAPAVGSGQSESTCPAATECPTGACCANGTCPF